MRRLVATIIATSAVAAMGTAFTTAAASASGAAHDAVVSADPADHTPHVLDGRVNAIAVVGTTVIVGGTFSRVQGADAFLTAQRHNIFAFDARTGRVEATFTPRIDGTVHALAPGPRGTVFVGGSFSRVGGEPRSGLAQLAVPSGRTTGTLQAASLPSGQVNALAVGADWLYVGGRFPGVGDIDASALARVDVRTGEVDRGFAMHVARPRRGTVSVKDVALSPGGSRLVIDGNFTRVAGRPRHQIAVINTEASRPRLANWATDAYTDRCRRMFHTYMRGIDFSPDGSYFVVVTTGGDVRDPEAMCDSAARWETGATGTSIEPTWVNRTGGDSLYSVAVTGAAVYIGGHQRWVSNPHGNDTAGPGAVPRKGIAALHPRSGEALGWNPTRTRGHGVTALVATPRGLLVGSDTERLGREHHGRIGMFPLE